MGFEPRHSMDDVTLDPRDSTNEGKSTGASLIGLQSISVIIHTLNEGTNIANLLIQLDQTLTGAGITYEAIVVDDHSTDNTVAAAEAIARDKNLPVRVLTKQGRPGKSFSLIEGFAAAQFDVLAMIDGDLQYPPDALPEMVRQLAHANIIVGDRRVHYGSASGLRGAMSQIFNSVVGMFFGIDTDMQSGLKVFHRKVYEGTVPDPSGWSFDLHLITKAVDGGYTVANVPIVFQQRQSGKSKVTPLAVAMELLMVALQLKITLTLPSIASRFGNRQQYKRFPQSNAVPNTPAADTNVVEQVKYYTALLAAEASYKRNSIASYREETNQYIDHAQRAVTVRGREVSTFAPFRDKLSALQTMTFGQMAILGAIVPALVLGLLFYGKEVLIATIAIIIVLYLGDLLLNFLLSMQTLSKSDEEQIRDEVVDSLADADWPRYTILCPLYREAKVVPQFVRGMQALDYPSDKLQVLFLTEEDDVETRDAIRAMHLPRHFKVVTVPAGEPRTKPRACNFGLLYAKGDYIVIYDAEDIPDPLQLKKAVLTFARQGPDVACVQAKLNFYNPRQNLLTRWFTAEYSLWFDLTLPGLQRAKLPLPLGGTSNHFRAEMLRALGAWDAFNVTEDCDLGLRLAHYGLKTAMLDSTTYEEANSRVKNWLRQRSRWIKGYMQTYLVYMRHPLRYLQPGHLREFLALQLIIGGKTAVLFVNPLMWLLLAIYILFRPLVGNAYQTLFPIPVLYMGTLCLVFGNFFYTYAHLVACIKRRQYSLIKWTLLIPIYWVMTSMAAIIALYQLIFKPHYWEKTQHGLHTSTSTLSSGISWVTEALESEETLQMETSMLEVTELLPRVSAAKALESVGAVRVPALSGASSKPSLIPSATEKVKVVKVLQKAERASIERLSLRLPKRPPAWQKWLKDSWLIATFVTACIASIASLCYFFQTHQILLYGDAYSHMLIARRLFDNATPGLAQLEGVWLPLPHLLMLPFIWNDYLWQTGLAGSFVSMPCYVISAVYLFLAARRLTRDSRVSFVGTLLFILNPNILYLQTTPLSELVLIATMTMACYHFLSWAQDDNPKQLILTAAGTFLATVACYDGWFLFLTLLVLIAIIGWIRHRRWTHIEGGLLVFSTLGSLGIGLWLLWCGTIFGDPLYFQRGPFSAQAQQRDLIQAHLLYTYHDLWQAIRYYLIDAIDTLGPILFVLTVIAVLVFVLRRRISPDMLAALAFLAPFAFYISSLYSGQASLFLPQAVPANAPYHLFNARYGAVVVAPAALFLSTLVGRWSTRVSLGTIGQVVLLIAIVVQAVLTAYGGIISLQDGQYGLACTPPHSTVIYLAQHYAGGRILEDLYTSKTDELEPEAGIDFKNIVYEGSGELWQRSLNDPTSIVNWVIANPKDRNDLVVKGIHLDSPTFLSRFTLVVQEQNGLSLYQRNGAPSVPTRPIPSNLLTGYSLCRASTASVPIPSPSDTTYEITSSNSDEYRKQGNREYLPTCKGVRSQRKEKKVVVHMRMAARSRL